MKTLIIAVNSKFIHSSLAPWYLKASCGNRYGDIRVLEFSINDNPDSIIGTVYAEKPDIAAFSCYIWNLEYVLGLAESLKKVLPELRIILGGPEVSYNAPDIMRSNTFIDCIISGEGEHSFRLLLCCLKDGSTRIGEIDGVSYREQGVVISNRSRPLIDDLDSIPSPYTHEMLSTLGNRIAYFESSRGCPYSCSYCLSSTFEGVRYFSMERVRQDLAKLINSGARIVKFVDRTFNCSRTRAKEIFRYIAGIPAGSFHFEVAADLFDEEMLDMLSGMPEGLVQLEIGIQTTNEATLSAVSRKTDVEKAFYNISRLIAAGNIHVHLDLIAGLPLEDFDSFRRSFNDVYDLKPHHLQLGFLKLLRGSRMREEAEEHGYQYNSHPPYEFLYNRYISYEQVLRLKGIEELLEKYYNSGRHASSLEFLIKKFFGTPFDFYSDFYNFVNETGYIRRAVSARDSYRILLKFAHRMADDESFYILKELMKLDFLASDSSGTLPDGLERDVIQGFKERCHDFLRDGRNITGYLPEYEGISVKQLYKQVHFEPFRCDVTGDCADSGVMEPYTVLLFDYSKKSRVTGLYKYHKVKLF